MLFLSGWLAACSHGPPAPSYNEIQDTIAGLEQAYPAIAQRVGYGRSVDGRNLVALRIASVPLRESAKSVLILGAIHGDEYMNIVDRLGGWLLSISDTPWLRGFLARGHRIYIVPIANPDGYENWRNRRFRPRRNNANRVDLNRDFDVISTGEKRFTQPETRSLIDLLERETASVRLVMNYHCCAGALAYPGGHYKLYMPDEDKQRHAEIAHELRGIFWGDIEIGDWKSVVDYTGVGVAIDYFYQRYHAVSFLYEGILHEDRFFPHHAKAWQYLLTRVVDVE
jgi:hypothetical protein